MNGDRAYSRTESLRESLIVWDAAVALIFFSRPISLGLMMLTIGLLVLAASIHCVLKRGADWRTKLAEVEAGETER